VQHTLDAPTAALDLVRSVSPARPTVAIVAGSGLGGLSALVTDAVVVLYEDLAEWPQVPSPPGHAGRLVLGHIGDVPVAVFDGRLHLYQGVAASDVSYPARLAAGLGAQTLVLTNAAGGIADGLHAGDIVLLADHLNLTGTSPLLGWPGPPGGVPFIPMADAWDRSLREEALAVAAELGIDLREGVYAGLLGPAYETPAEVRMLRTLGADVVGMSTVIEAIAARALGMRLLGISLVTNVAGHAHLSHDEVLEAGAAAEDRLTRLMVGMVPILHRLSPSRHDDAGPLGP